jgi:DNA-binding response OmpR family regulator
MKKILYIEDNQDTAEAVKIMLNHAGFDTQIESCGKDGIRKAKEENFDLILLDIMLPDMSGWDIFETLKNKNLKSKFAFLSAIPISTERMQELKKAGISDYITKPFTKKDLLEKVKKMIS